MSQLVKDAARLLAGFVLTFGMYLMLHGHSGPGGGFAGGVVMAASFILLVLAYGRNEGGLIPEPVAVRWQSLGVIGLVLVGLLGLVHLDVLYRNLPFPGGWDKGTLLASGTTMLSDLAIGTAVWMGLVAAFMVLATFRRGAGKEQ